MINIQEQLQKYWFLNWNKFWDQDWINNPLHVKHFPHVYCWMTINGVLFKTYCIHLDQWVCIVIKHPYIELYSKPTSSKKTNVSISLSTPINCVLSNLHNFLHPWVCITILHQLFEFYWNLQHHCNQWASYNSTPINWVLLEPTASIKTDESVSSAHVKLNFGVCQKFRPMEGQGHIAQLDVPTVWVR